MLFHLAPLALALPLAQGIQLREPTPLATSTQWWAANQLVGEADRFAFTWVQPAGSLRATWSDGRALDWSAATPVPLAPPGAALLNYHSTLVGDRLVVCWNDNRNHIGAFNGTPQWGAFVRTVSVPDGAGGADLPLPAFGFPVQTETRVQAIASALVDGQRHVHLVMSAQTWLPPARYELRLVSSHDGGASFPHILELDLDSTQFTPLALAAEGPAVHVAIGPRHFRSLDGGVTLDPSAAPLLPAAGGGSFGGVRLHRSGGKVTAAWVRSELPPGATSETRRLDATVSDDGGTTFAPAVVLATENGSIATLQLRQVLAMPAADTAVVGWTRDLLGFPQGRVYASVKDGPSGWSTSELVDNNVNDLRWVGLAGDPDSRERIVVSWASAGQFFPLFSASFVRVSRDGGRTFEPTQAATNDGSIALGIGYSSTYQNAAIVSHDGAGWLAGGGRLQSLEPTGFVAGPTQLGAQFEGFDDGSQTAWMLAALGPGHLPWVDGRNLGLSIDFLLADSIGLAASGVFAAPLGATGSGQLNPIALSIPFGVSVSFVGLSIDLLTFEVRDISDVVSVTAQ